MTAPADTGIAVQLGGQDLYRALPKQEALHRAAVPNVLYGGAAGGGKSHALRWHALMACLEHTGFKALLLRREFVELRDTHLLALDLLPPVLGTYKKSDQRWVCPNGSLIQFGHANTDSDFASYLSSEWGMILVDEAGQFSPWMLTMLPSRLRVPVAAPYRPQLALASNPGGPAHTYLHRMFIAKTGPEDAVARALYRPEEYAFIAATVEDNPHVDEAYIARLRALPAVERAMYLEGSWDLPAGNLYAELAPQTHRVAARPLTDGTRRVAVADWGWTSPAPVVWFETDDGVQGLAYSRAYREWVPTETVPQAWAQSVIAQSKRPDGTLEIEAVILDAAAFDPGQSGGPTVAEQMLPTFRAAGIRLLESVKGKDSIRHSIDLLHTYFWTNGGRLTPLLTIGEECPQLWDALVTIQRGNPAKGQPVDLPAPRQAQMHLHDCVRYWAMSRPRAAEVPLAVRMQRDPVLGPLAALDHPASFQEALQRRAKMLAAPAIPVRAAFPPKRPRRPWER